MAIEIKMLTVGPLQSNCYVVIETESKEALLVDPGAEPEKIKQCIEQAGAHVVAIVLTHSHGDHIGAVGDMKEHTGAPILVHPEEADWLTDPQKNLSAMFEFGVSTPPPDKLLNEGDTVSVGGETFQVFHTPGHSPGAISLYCEGILISGDLIFEMSVGRFDLPGGDEDILKKSIRTKVYTLPDNTKIYSGHGDVTTVEFEKQNNPFVRSDKE